jgi:hypothetical protein
MDLMVCHPTVDQPIDYKGLPGIVNDMAEFMPYGNLRRMMEATEPLLVFFDDLGQAPETIQKALMQLLLERGINGQKISDQVTFIAATNRKEDKAGVTGLLEPVKSRFMSIIELEFHVDDWVEWAVQAKIEPSLIAFAQYRPNLLDDFKPTKDMTNSCNPRTMEMLNTLVQLKLPVESRLEAYQGAIGHASREFYAFEEMNERLIHPNDILRNPAKAQLPDNGAPDVCYATAAGLAHYVEKETMPALCEYLWRFDNKGLLEYSVLCMRMLQQKDESLTNCQDWIKWASKHKDDIV